MKSNRALPWILTLVAFAAIVGPPVASQTNIANNAAEMVNKIVMLADGATPRTVTNLFTFDRDPNPPFAVSAGSAKVSNLDADLLDGVDSTGFITTTAFGPLDRNECGLRLTLTSGTPVTTADVTAATSVFITPTHGGLCSFSDGISAWTVLQPTEVTIALGADAASTLYDVFCYNNSGTIACERLAWTSDTARATAIVLQQNIWSKSGALTRRYIGTYRTTTIVGQTEDSFAKRYVWSYYYRQPRVMRVNESTDTWPYTTATWRQANAGAGTGNQLDFVVGVAEVWADVSTLAHFSNTNVAVNAGQSIGYDSTTTPTTGCRIAYIESVAAGRISPITSTCKHAPAVGRHTYVWLEYSGAVGASTFYGDNAGTILQSGIEGMLEN